MENWLTRNYDKTVFQHYNILNYMKFICNDETHKDKLKTELTKKNINETKKNVDMYKKEIATILHEFCEELDLTLVFIKTHKFIKNGKTINITIDKYKQINIISISIIL